MGFNMNDEGCCRWVCANVEMGRGGERSGERQAETEEAGDKTVQELKFIVRNKYVKLKSSACI